jgi:hypothetical protein
VRAEKFIHDVFTLFSNFWPEPVKVGFCWKAKQASVHIAHTAGDFFKIQKTPIVAYPIRVAPEQAVIPWGLCLAYAAIGGNVPILFESYNICLSVSAHAALCFSPLCSWDGGRR